MASLAVRKTTWQAQTVRDRQILRYLASDVLELGQPAHFKAPSTAIWFIFDDWRFDLAGVSWFGALVANISDVPPGYIVPVDGDGNVDMPALRSDAKGFLTSKRVWPVTILDDDPNPWQTVLDAQGAPAAVQMASGVPVTWTAVESP